MNSQQLSGAAVPNKNSHAVPGTRVVLSLAIAAMLSACALAPGQHMITPAALPVTSADNGDVTSDMQIPIKQIDLTLIRQIRAEQKNNATAQGQLNLFAKPSGYRLGSGDVLQIVVWDHPELAAALGQPAQNNKPSDAAPGFVVDSDGNIQFPYVTHPIHAAGKTAEQVQREIYTDLSKVFVKPQVTVRVASFRASQVYVDGDVRAPGAQTINDIPMTLTEAVSRAGGFAPTADQSRVTITRNGTAYPVNVAQMMKQGKNPADIMLQPGDMLHVDARDDNTVYVMGEVTKPTAVSPLRDGTLTLGEAIVQAGQINQETSNASQLFVVRQATSDSPVIYRLDARSPVSMLLANQFPLESKDVVYVDNSGLVRANRVLNLLLPAINAGLTAAIVTK
ncbi:polysaccharide biosynthesis/export family protein [Caballeronia mineralivorans]|uniref:polysaccharide biosynthesis/export family protein n=1 Tax=Caballeronia mineralivorans TaxID=2010198 RepID=UPI0023F030B3|nr:polysaccharide biosynthesis/export family protein [Caballeronia mineralivorans]MDB5782457.1 sugar transporter substrate-binding protein [Caballeronia mineralivorans]MEA3103917.1 polysaccharide biosynthesis/export protein [Caballeronia mineralivorans]